MKKTLIFIMAAVVAISMIFMGIACEAKVAEEKKPVFGNIPVAMADEWNGYGVQNFKYCAEKKGVEVVVLDSEWDGEKALQNMEDLITRGVDEISVFVWTPEQAQDFIYKANDAGIPISFENTKIYDKVEGDIVFNVACEYYDIGYAAAKYISEKWPGSRLFYVKGAEGMGIVEEYQRGIDDALTDCGDVVEIVDIKTTGWDTETSMNVTQDTIAAGTEFDVIFANSEEMAVGVIQALDQAGLKGQIPIVSTGGGPNGIKMIEDGEIVATMAAPVSVQGMWLFKAMWLHYNGKEIKDKWVPLPTIPIDKDTLADNVSWDPSDEIIDYIGGLDEW